MSKKAVIFSTRFIGDDSFLFNNKVSCRIVNNDLCNFFLSQIDNENKKAFHSFLRNDSVLLYIVRKWMEDRNLWDNDLSSKDAFDLIDDIERKKDVNRDKIFSSEKEIILENKEDLNFNDIIENIGKYSFEDIKKLSDYVWDENNFKYLLEKFPRIIVSTLELADTRKQKEKKERFKLNINCNKENVPLFYYRYLLYYIRNTDNALYAVWCLGKPLEKEDVDKWYNLLCDEILSDNNYDEISLILHDNDVQPHTPFEVLKINDSYHKKDENKEVLRNIAVFQHDDDIAELLLDSDDSIDNIVKNVFGFIETYGSLKQLKEMSDLIKDDNLGEEFNKAKEKLVEVVEESKWKKDFHDLELCIDAYNSSTHNKGEQKYAIIQQINNQINLLCKKL